MCGVAGWQREQIWGRLELGVLCWDVGVRAWTVGWGDGSALHEWGGGFERRQVWGKMTGSLWSCGVCEVIVGPLEGCLVAAGGTEVQVQAESMVLNHGGLGTGGGEDEAAQAVHVGEKKGTSIDPRIHLGTHLLEGLGNPVPPLSQDCPLPPAGAPLPGTHNGQG